MPHFYPWTVTAAPIVALLAGFALLLFGRRLFWLFVGVIGFMAGWYLAVGAWHQLPAGGRLLLALLAGVAGLVLALMAQKIAVALAGFFIGFYALAHLLGWSWQALHPAQILLLVVAGIVAAAVALLLFDLALIIYSSLAGSELILGAAHLRVSGQVRLLLLLVLAAFGAAVQARWLDHRSRLRR